MTGNGEDKTLDHYAAGHIRKTVYGPPQLIPRFKRYRVMDRSEYITYTKKIQESGGFDVDGCSGSLPGGIMPVHPTSCEWQPAELAAKFAAVKQAEEGGIPLDYKQLLKVNIQSVCGVMYYLTFTAVDSVDLVEKIYRSKVLINAGSTEVELKSFEVDTESNKTAEEMRKEMTDLLQIISEKQMEIHNTPVPPEGAVFWDGVECELRGVDVSPALGELQRRGFQIFMKEIKSKNSNWKYAKVRKTASRKWRSFAVYDKLPYVIEAEKEFNEKHRPKH